jgi:hypothetical protein
MIRIARLAVGPANGPEICGSFILPRAPFPHLKPAT